MWKNSNCLVDFIGSYWKNKWAVSYWVVNMLESDTEITQKMVGLGLLIENPEQLKVTKINKSLPPKVGSLMKVQIHGIVHDEDRLLTL